MARATRKIVRIDPANHGPVLFALIATGVIVLVSFVLSYAALSTLAGWMSLPPYLGPLVPVFIDGAIIVYTYSAIAAKAEGESTIRPWLWVGLWTVVSSGANGAHAWFNGDGGTESLVGSILAGLIPLGSLLGTHEIASRVIVRPEPVQVSTRARVSTKASTQASRASSRLDNEPVQVDVQVDDSAPVQVDTGGVQVDTGAVQQVGVQVDTDGVQGGDQFDREARHVMIRQMYSDGVRKTDIARRLGVSRTTVYAALGVDH